MIVGHTHRISNLMRGHILITEGINAGASYSVLQLMVRDGDVAWAGGATRVAKTIGVAPRAGCAGDRGRGQRRVSRPRTRSSGPGVRHLPRPHPPPRVGDGQPRRRRDARQVRRRGRGGLHELGRPPGRTSRATRRAPARRSCEITLGELFAVLPFGNATVDRDAHRRPDARTAFINGFSPFCNSAVNTGRFPQIVGPARPSSTATARPSSSTASGRPRRRSRTCRSPPTTPSAS